AAEAGVNHADRHLAVEVSTFALEKLVLFDRHLNIEVTARAAVGTRFTFARQTDTVTGVHSGWHFDVEGFGFFDPTAAAAITAGVGNDLAFTTTGRTGLLNREEALLH